jgi:nitronate monooxygenase
MRTLLTQRLGIALPIIQAPMAGGGDTAELVAAVSNAGGLGSIGAAYLTPEQIVERGRAVRAATARPFGINLFAPQRAPEVSPDAVEHARDAVAEFYAELGLTPPAVASPATSFDDQLAACLETGASVFSFTFGLLPAEVVLATKRRGMVLMGTATTVAEAEVLAAAGVDAVVAQGSEAGGHRGTFLGDFDGALIGTMALVPQICDAVDVPVVASGGIMDGRGVAASLALGASAAQLGTAFLVCEEAGISEAYRAAIFSAREDQTRLTRAFSGKPARGIANRFLTGMSEREDAILPFPLQNGLTRPLRTESAKRNQADYLSLWAGQGVRLARRRKAGELMEALRVQMEAAVRRVSPAPDPGNLAG